MRTITLPDEKLKQVLAALEHSGSSVHHSHCSSKKTMHCDCHVAKAKAAFEVLRAASQRIRVPATDLKEGQMLVTTTGLVRIVSVQKCPGILPKFDVQVDYDDAGATPAETLTFGADDPVLIVDLTL